jgi:small subunit ribosomal protein S15
MNSSTDNREENKKKIDTGSAESQIRFLVRRIDKLVNHVKNNIHDNVTKLSIIKLVSKRRKQEKYLKNKDFKRYELFKKQLAEEKNS